LAELTHIDIGCVDDIEVAVVVKDSLVIDFLNDIFDNFGSDNDFFDLFHYLDNFGSGNDFLNLHHLLNNVFDSDLGNILTGEDEVTLVQFVSEFANAVGVSSLDDGLKIISFDPCIITIIRDV